MYCFVIVLTQKAKSAEAEARARALAATTRMKRWQRPGDEEDEEFSTHDSSFCLRLSLPGTGLGASHGGQGMGLGGDEEGEEASEARP